LSLLASAASVAATAATRGFSFIKGGFLLLMGEVKGFVLPGDLGISVKLLYFFEHQSIMNRSSLYSIL